MGEGACRRSMFAPTAGRHAIADAALLKRFSSDRTGAAKLLAGTMPGATLLFSQERAVDHALKLNHLRRDGGGSIVKSARIGAGWSAQGRSAMVRAEAEHAVIRPAVYAFVPPRFTGGEG